MQQANQEPYPYQTNEINLGEILNSLIARKFLIAGLTGFVTVLAILYALNLAPTYQATSSFTSPSTISITTINRLNFLLTEKYLIPNDDTSVAVTDALSVMGSELSETKESIFSKFLTKLSSKDFQKQAFLTGDFLTKFNIGNIAIVDVDAFISATINSVIVKSPNITSKDENLGFELPYSVTMVGGNAEAISEYLNSLVNLANSKTIIELIKLNELKTSNRLDDISLERELLLAKAERARMSEIDRIKEQDGELLREIKNKITRVRLQAKQKRLDKIVQLTSSAKIAKSLGIIENNLNKFNGSNNYSVDSPLVIFDTADLPEWYLFGEKALIQRVEILKNRVSDDPFIPELIDLTNKLSEIQSDNILKTLETRVDDSPFIFEIVKLDIEKIKLKSRKIDMNGVNAMQLSQISIPPSSPFKPNKRMIVLLAFIGSLMMSVFLALIMGALKPDEKASPA